ncbi:MAG: hypothetical protein WC565_04265 [Parcubacteria group bacterium]
MARTKVKASEGTKPATAEGTESTETETTETDEGSAGDEDDDEVLTPMPVKVQPKAPKKPRRNLGGVYKTKNQIRFNGDYQAVGTVLTLTDEEARHYLKFGAVEAVEEDED